MSEVRVGRNRGSDPFKWVLLVAIGFECMSVDSFREFHGITLPFDEVKDWIRNFAELGSHDGDCDYLSLFSGEYKDFIPQRDGARQ